MSSVASSSRLSLLKECDICRESLRPSLFIGTKGCAHEYCAACIQRHSEAKFLSGNSHIQCPHENCKQNYSSLQCRALLSKSNYSILQKRLEEASTPPMLRFYCPYRDCSAFMRKRRRERRARFQCIFCDREVCLQCNLAWHAPKLCAEFRAEEANRREGGDEKLRDLVKEKGWQTCKSCQRVVERMSGCDNIYCICKIYFCYKCGNLGYNCHCQFRRLNQNNH